MLIKLNIFEPWIKVRASQPQSGQVRRALLAAGFQVTVGHPQEVDGTRRRCFLCGKRRTERHSTDAGHAINQSAYLIVRQWSIILVNNAFKNKSDHSKP